MGKTALAHIYIRNYGTEYDKIEFFSVNNDIREDFNKELRSCITTKVPTYSNLLKTSEGNTSEDITRQIDAIICKANKKCLLVIDVNITDSSADFLTAPFFSDTMKSKWHIMYLSRQRIEGAKSIELPNLENDFEGAKGLFNSIYGNRLSENELNTLFRLICYHPLLIEQLAAYGIRGIQHKTYKELQEAVSENTINNATINKRYSEYSTCFIDKEKTKDICVYLNQLFNFETFTNDEKYIISHFILWEYDFIPISAINMLLNKNDNTNLENVLLDLSDKMVFSQSDDEFRIHGLLADTIRNIKLDFDYTNYINNIKNILKMQTDYDDNVKKMIHSTPNRIFINEKDFSIYKDWEFLMNLAKIKHEDAIFSELAYKIKLLNTLYGYTGKEIYEKVNGEYKNISSHLIYYKWLDKQQGYTVDIKKFSLRNINDITFMVKEMKLYKEGIFYMGAQNYNPSGKNYDEYAEPHESPVHKVALSSFYVSYPITQELWNIVMGTNIHNQGSFFHIGNVTWYDCMDFIIKINNITKLKFRLPREAEFEYAIYDNHDVANMWEWCLDLYDKDFYEQSPIQNPLNLTAGDNRVIRGGMRFSNISNETKTRRNESAPIKKSINLGFRLVLSANNQ